MLTEAESDQVGGDGGGLERTTEPQAVAPVSVGGQVQTEGAPVGQLQV